MLLVCRKIILGLPIHQHSDTRSVSTPLLLFYANHKLIHNSVLMSVMTILAHISAVAVPLTAASHAISAAHIFFTIIDAPKPSTTGLTDPDILMNDDIVLENVNFAYPTRPDVKVLDGLTLRFPVGKTTAIVGSSGSGKSTVVGLLQRWYQLDGDMGANALVSFPPAKISGSE
jgi:ATP-binding cassette subfamily B (MDR/TAP) protein 1